MVLSLWLRAIARVHAVHLMNADSAPDGGQPSRPSQTTWAATVHIHQCYYYSARKLIRSLPSHGGRRAEST